MNCWQAVSVCLDFRPGKRSRFSRCLFPLFIYHPLVLSWPVNCWPVSASLASLAWPMPVYWPVDSARIVTAGKNAFPTAVFESGPVWTKYFLRLSCDPFFSNTCSMSLYQLLVLVFCKQFCARSREMDIWKHKTVFCKLEPQWNNSKRHFAPRTLAVAVIGGQTDIPEWNCRLQLFANWLIAGWQQHLQAKSTNWGKKQKQYEISWSRKCFRLLACKLWRCSKFERGTTL